MMENFLGYSVMWQEYFANYPGTEATIISNIRTNQTQLFVYYSYLAINDETTLRNTVSQLSGQNTESWLDAVETQYGTTYLQELSESIGYSLDPIWNYSLNENHIYGSARVGLVTRDLLLAQQVVNSTTSVTFTYLSDSIKIFYRGEKRYELSNHLRNVLATITDRRIQVCGAGEVMYYEAQVVTMSDYYPFGMQIDSRTFTNTVDGYRFGFQGQERDDEVVGEGNSMTAEFWQYDSRLGRRWNIDPVDQIGVSNYAALLNNPIIYTDLKGNTQVVGTEGEVLYDDKKKDGNLYKFLGDNKEGEKYDFTKLTNLSAKELKKELAGERFKKLAEGVKVKGETTSKWVGSEQDLKDHVESQFKLLAINYNQIKYDFAASGSGFAFSGTEKPKKIPSPYNYVAVKVSDKTDWYFKVKLTDGINKSKAYWFGDVYSLRNIIVHENDHKETLENATINEKGYIVYATFDDFYIDKANGELKAINAQRADASYEQSSELHKKTVKAYEDIQKKKLEKLKKK